MIGAWLETLRYDHPGVYRGLIVAIMVFVMCTTFLMLPDSPMLRAMGVTGVQKRVAACSNAVYWSSRASMNNTPSSDKPSILYGNMEGIDQAGKLIVTVSSGNQWIRYNYAIADIVITDIYSAAQQVGALRLENARFEVYRGDQVVVWVRGVPLNVKLIEAGAAKPDPNPPTDIVDTAFATYYWGIVKGKSTSIKGENT